MKEVTRSAVRLLLGRKAYERVQFYRHTGYWPNLREPRTFNEKLCHRKFSNSCTWASLVQDKWAVRKLVEERVGPEVLNDVYCVVESGHDLNFDELPKAFVMKGTDGAGPGSIEIVTNKFSLGPERLSRRANQILRRRRYPWRRFFWYTNEWWYREIAPRVMVERHLLDGGAGVPADYKFMVFDGRVEVIQVDLDRFVHHTRALYTRTWDRLPVIYRFPAAREVPRPENLEEMIEIAEGLGEGFDFVRVDLYNMPHGHIVFGEMTVCPDLGHGWFQPPEYDYWLGQLWSVVSGYKSKSDNWF